MAYSLSSIARNLTSLSFVMFLSVGAFAIIPASTVNAQGFEIEGEEASANDPMPNIQVAPQETAQTNTSNNAISTEAFELAKEIIRLYPIETEINNSIDGISKQLKAEKRALFKSIVSRSIKIDRLNAAAELAFVEIFTVGELRAMRDYYKSEEGRAIRNKMPQFETRMEPVISQMVQDALFNVQNSNIDFR
jgi:hypothetical protein